MKLWRMLLAIPLVVAGSGTAAGQDAVKVSPKNYRVVIDNPSVRVLRVTVPAGGKTAVHSHPESVVIALAASKVRFTGADGKSEDADLPNESARFAPAETHSGANTGTTPVDALVVEFKTAAAGQAAIPTNRENMAMKVLAESPRAVAHRVTADATFQEPAGSKHEYDQLVVALSNAQMSLSLDGKPAKTTWRRGDVVFIPRGTPHESKNAGGKPVDFIIVAIR